MGATELSNEKNSMIVDIGGTTTDIAFVKNGTPQRVKNGIRIGKWNTFVKGLFVDTFGLGGDSGIVINQDNQIELEDEKAIPLCMAAERYPNLVKYLEHENNQMMRITNQRKNIYVCVRDISENESYTQKERDIARIMREPHSLEQMKDLYGEVILVNHLERLLREGVLLRCGLTPTDIMHVKGDFVQYNKEAAQYGVEIMARIVRLAPEELCEQVYDVFKKKLYTNIVRILIEDAFPRIREIGLGEQTEILIANAYEQAKSGEPQDFFGITFRTPATLVGVGAPTKLFLEDVGRLLGTKVVMSEYSPVANALGAVIGNVSASVQMEVVYSQETDGYVVFGNGQRIENENLEASKEKAKKLASIYAAREAVERGADEKTLEVTLEEEENIAETEFGPVYMGYKVTATASGNLRLS